jgi:hypothetical protein
MANTSGYPPPAGWEDSLLQQLGAPSTAANKQFFDDWAVAEHGTGTAGWGGTGPGEGAGAYNPFNTTLDEPGATSGNSVGVKNYPSWQVGEQATVSTLQQSNMAPILQALQDGSATVTELETAEGQTPWGQEPGWPSNVIPATGSGGLNTSQGWQNYGIGGASWTGSGSSSGSGNGSNTNSTALLTSAPWGGLLGSQIEEAVFMILGIALVIVGLVITFKSGNEDNPNDAPVAKKASHAEEAAELAAA